MSLLKRLFGGGEPPAPATEDYKEFTITPQPIREGSTYRIAAKIEKDGKVHELIRADTMEGLDQAQEASVRKAKQMIDEQGDRIFG